MGASIEVEPCAKGSVAGCRVVIDAVGMVQGLSQLATLPDPPTGAIKMLLSSVQFEQTDQPESIARKRLAELSGKDMIKENTTLPVQCDLCPRTYVNKWNLARHVNTAHTAKRKRLVETEVFECEECDYMCASQAALETHVHSHSSSTEATKSQRYKCAFCNKELASIYTHYASKHRIEFPEQIMFDDGNVLVYSSINPDGGKAPWFLKEKEKLNLYTDVTCRLCEAETCFDDREKLAVHYVMDHMVDPGILDHLKRVFRAEKGVHLNDLPASQIPKRKQSGIVTPVIQKVSRTEENGHSSKVYLKKQLEDQASKKPEPIGVFNCKECDQVYTTEALLNKHINDNHAPKIGDKAKCQKYKCCLCNKDLIGIDKHYGMVHKIEYPEQMMFENGNVLVRTDINSNCGQAPWFKSQKEKAEKKYTSSTCRLCDVDFYGTGINLDRHYLIEHKVEQDTLKRLNNLRCLFRADKGAHLVDMPTSRPTRRVSSYQSTTRPVNSGSKSDECILRANAVEQDMDGLIIYQCVECGVATTTCDASIEHAQLHHFAGYKAIPQTCGVCKFSFEAECFADHSTNHLKTNEYRIVKFDPSKLLDNWSVLFQGLSENHAERIKSSSTYQHTRRVKMNSNMASGIPLYQCGKCELCVRPKDVEGHCYNHNCIENQAPGHFCPDCEKYFYTSVALTEHEKDHKTYGADSFRIVTFNCKEDEPINRALQNLQNNSNSFKVASLREALVSGETQQRIRGVKILQNFVVKRFCVQCKQSIFYSEFDAHAASHRNNQNSKVDIPPVEVNERVQEEGSQKRNSGVSNDKANQIPGERLQTKETETGANEEGTVELWSSDSASGNSLTPPVSSFEVQVEVHVQKEEVEDDFHDNQCADNMQEDVQCIFDEFSEEMENDLKKDIQHLGVELFGMTYIPDENLGEQDMLELKKQLTELKETSNDDRQDEDNDKAKLMTDSLSQDPTNENAFRNNGKQNANNQNDIIVIEDDSDEEIEFQEVTNNSRMSSRDILTRMLSK